MTERGNSFLRCLDRYLGIPLLGIMSMGRISSSHTNTVIPESINKICVYCPGAIGDLLLGSALLNGLRRLFPEAWLEVVASPANAQVLPLLPMLDSSRVFPVTAIPAIVQYMRSQKYDVLLDLSQWSRQGAIISACSGARIKAGFKTAGQFRHMSYDIVAEHSQDLHEMDNFLALGKAIWPAFTGSPDLQWPEPARGMDNVICCHMWPSPGRHAWLKEWPETCWAELINILRKNRRIFLTGSRANLGANEKFKNHYFARDKNVCVPEPMPLVELSAIFRSVKAVISVNTGIMHLAALSGAPTIGLHGPTNPKRWGPIGQNCVSLLPQKGERGYLNLGFEYPDRAQPCLQFLTVGNVLQSLDSFF